MVSIVDLTMDNLAEYGLFCIRNPKAAGYQAKAKWLKQRFAEGLKFRLMVVDEGSPAGFIEYVPGEHNWRALEAPGYLVIHCMMLYPRKHHGKGYGKQLVRACIDDAKAQGKLGVAVLASDGTWCADGRLFEQLGFEAVAQSDRFTLMVKKLKRGPLPKFRDWEGNLAKTTAWQLCYAHQCPWHAKAVEELPAVAEGVGIDLRLRELKTPQDAQNSPAAFGVFALAHGGNLLADHYISPTRFRTVLSKTMGTGKKTGKR